MYKGKGVKENLTLKRKCLIKVYWTESNQTDVDRNLVLAIADKNEVNIDCLNWIELKAPKNWIHD